MTRTSVPLWAFACAVVAGLLDVWYVGQNSTGTANFAVFDAALVIAALLAAITHSSARVVLLAAVASGSLLLGGLTASIGLILLLVGALALAALLIDLARTNGHTWPWAVVGSGLGAAFLAVVRAAPKFPLR